MRKRVGQGEERLGQGIDEEKGELWVDRRGGTAEGFFLVQHLTN